MRRESRDLRSTFACHADDVTCADNSDSRPARGSSPLAHFTSPRASVVRRSSVVWLDSVSTSSHQIGPKSTSILAPRILIEQSNIAAMSHWFQQYPAIHCRPAFIAAFQRNISQADAEYELWALIDGLCRTRRYLSSDLALHCQP